MFWHFSLAGQSGIGPVALTPCILVASFISTALGRSGIYTRLQYPTVVPEPMIQIGPIGWSSQGVVQAKKDGVAPVQITNNAFQNKAAPCIICRGQGDIGLRLFRADPVVGFRYLRVASIIF